MKFIGSRVNNYGVEIIEMEIKNRTCLLVVYFWADHYHSTFTYLLLLRTATLVASAQIILLFITNDEIFRKILFFFSKTTILLGK